MMSRISHASDMKSYDTSMKPMSFRLYSTFDA